jgi:hypothetical protein
MCFNHLVIGSGGSERSGARCCIFNITTGEGPFKKKKFFFWNLITLFIK